MSAVPNERAALLAKAYAVLSDVTPLRYDCGRLCGAACCAENDSHGEGEVCGMLLLPGEKEWLSHEPYTVLPTKEGELLVCSGTCRRDMRPFACRIFPYYPKITPKGDRFVIDLRPDPRAMGICPILWEKRNRKVRISFLRAAKKAARTLLRDEEIRKELIAQSEFLSDIECLRRAYGE